MSPAAQNVSMPDAEAAARQRVLSLISSFWRAQAIHAAIALDIPARIEKAPATAEEIAAAAGADAESVFRLLRSLAALNLVVDHGARRFSLTGDGRCLLADAPGSLRGLALHVGTMLWPAFGQLHECVRTGRPPPGVRHGPDGFAALETNAEEAAIFNQSMVDGSRRVAALALESFDFSRFRTVMDVGGGWGALLAELLKAHPRQRGIILDLVHCEQGARAYQARQGVGDRAEFVTGSFFDPIPARADCYLLKYIIHDWNDDHANKIMARVAEAARASGGTVILIERVLPDRIEATPEHRGAVQGDLTMMLWDGRERTGPEYRRLYSEAGLVLRRIIPIGDGFSVIEGGPQ